MWWSPEVGIIFVLRCLEDTILSNSNQDKKYFYWSNFLKMLKNNLKESNDCLWCSICVLANYQSKCPKWTKIIE